MASRGAREGFGHGFADPALLQRALTHRSAGGHNNERLEFLGDAVVNLVVADALHARWPDADEGALTRARAELVRESTLAEIARELELGDALTLGAGEIRTGGFRRDSILADALEAVVGAIHLDAGFEACRTAVLPWFQSRLDALPAASQVGKDPKTRLQEWLQARQKPLPVYRVLEEKGEEHARVFSVECLLDDPPLRAEADGTSRRAAEQAAAAEIMENLPSSR